MSLNSFRVPRAAAASVIVAAMLVACHRDPSPRIHLATIEQCESGIQRAVNEHPDERAARTYHESCADLYVEKGCRDAFFQAGSVRRDRRDKLILNACRKDYCPLLTDERLEACQPGFDGSSASIARALAPLDDAIVAYDARGTRHSSATSGFGSTSR